MRKLVCIAVLLVAGPPLGASAAWSFNPLDTTNSYDLVILANDNLADMAGTFAALHPTLRTCLVRLSEVQAAFPGGTTVGQIRSFVTFAYQNWKIAPTYLLLVGDADMVEPSYDLLPTYVAENPYFNDSGWPNVYANDGYYVSSPVAGQVKPIIHLGRIPARVTYEVWNVYHKVYLYQRIAGTPAWLQRILMLVGDAPVNERFGGPLNATYTTLNDELMRTELSGWNPANITTVYAKDYWRQSDDARTQVVRSAWNSGYGLVNALGNTYDIDWLVFMAYFNLPGYGLGTGDPTFTGSLANTNYLPVVFGTTCFTNWFHDSHQLSVGEDLLLTDPEKGAVAVIGPSNLADMVETYALNRTFLHELVSNGVRNIGRLYSAAKSKFATQNQGHAVFSEEYALLGDPAMDIKLGPLPAPTAYACSMEIEDAPVLQDIVTARAGDITSDNLRVVNQAAGVAPVAGERMVQLRAHDGLGTASTIEWKIQELNLTVTQNMILSFWMNLQASPSDNGKLVIDGNTSSGRLKDRTDVFTQDGVPLDAKERTPTGPGWKFYYADLSPLRDATLQDIRVRYESTSPADSGSLVAYFDDVRVKRYEPMESQELVNHSFEEDVDGNGTPDFWTDLNGVPTTLSAIRSDAFKSDGNYSVVVQDIYANGGGAKQVFTANVEVRAYTMVLGYYAPDPTNVRLRIRDLEAGTLLLDTPVAASTSWQTVSPTFGNPYYGIRPARFSLEIAPEDPLRPVYVDNVEMFPPVVVGVGGPSPSVDEGSARLLGVMPNPGRSGQVIRVNFELPREAQVRTAIFDVVGRLLADVPAQRVSAGIHWSDVTIGESPVAQCGGLCFVRMSVDGRWMPDARKVVFLP